MSEAERIADQLKRAFEGEAWHGPSVSEVLAGVDSEKAGQGPVGCAHSIWEIVLHIATWESIALRRVAGEVIDNVPSQEDWLPVTDATEAAWQEVLENLKRGNQRLCEAISRLSDARLNEEPPGAGYSLYVLLHGVIQHDLYHAGQIAILRKVF